MGQSCALAILHSTSNLINMTDKKCNWMFPSSFCIVLYQDILRRRMREGERECVVWDMDGKESKNRKRQRDRMRGINKQKKIKFNIISQS